MFFSISNPLHLLFFPLLPISYSSGCPCPLRLLPNLPLSSFFSLLSLPLPLVPPRFFIKTTVSCFGLRLKLEDRQSFRKRDRKKDRLEKGGRRTMRLAGGKPLGPSWLVRLLNKQTDRQTEALLRIPSFYLPQAKSHLLGIQLTTRG